VRSLSYAEVPITQGLYTRVYTTHVEDHPVNSTLGRDDYFDRDIKVCSHMLYYVTDRR